MRLSELHTGESGVIVKVNGHGGFRKRIVEMGFIKGKSLRHSEANMIEVVTAEEAKKIEEKERRERQQQAAKEQPVEDLSLNDDSCVDLDVALRPNDKSYEDSTDLMEKVALQERKVINVALVGNPNCGKTSFFNFASGAHERVGNYSGVTVDAKEGHASFEGYQFNIVDLPGTYSLSAYSPEELYVRKQLIEKTPDVVINVIDTSNLERNLYLTTQLIDMHVRMVVALNMFDETQKRGDHINYDKLSELFGVPMVPTVFKSGKGVSELFHQIIEVYEGTEDAQSHYRHIHINHGHEIEHGISEIQEHLKKEENVRELYSTRYLAIKLLEHDQDVEKFVSALPDAKEIFYHRDKAENRVKEETKEDAETAIMDAKYGFIHGALNEAAYEEGHKEDTYQITHVLDRILTNKIVGFPIFLLLIAIMFFVTFSLGSYPMDWIDSLVGMLGDAIGHLMPEGPVKAMLVDGIIGGVGSVIVFLPQILILYFFISIMEDSGYMARAAFIMDKLMHKMGLHGKSFIPLIMGFGCNVPAVMATRTIESRRSRLYLIGIFMAVIISKLMTKYIVKGEDTPFVMELPPYRFPTAKAVFRHTWEKGRQYLKKMGGIILVATIIVWALGYFPHNDQLSVQQQQEQSYIGRIGKTIEPIFYPQGFNWKFDVGIVAGVGAKEIVASTMGVLYTNDDSYSEDKEYNGDGGKYEHLNKAITADIAKMHGMTTDQARPVATLTAFCFLLFVLLYFPCVATLAAIKGETGSWKWALFTACYTTALAWIVSAIVYQVGRLFL